MCGISGAVGFEQEVKHHLKAFNESLLHRGPDGEGIFEQGSVFLGHRRLSIIDLDNGQQPMFSEDKNCVIVFNGELYNFRELRIELEKAGISFKTTSDTEVILYAYKVWGQSCLNRFRGMFSFAIVDYVSNHVFIARDHFGIKPLLYYQGSEGFFFASELSAFKKLPFLNFSINSEALDQYLWHQYIPAPNTIFKNIHKLPPANFLKIGFNGKVLEKQKYWQFKFTPEHSPSMSDWVEETDNVIKSSVKSHLVSDVPFGAFLSGGIDSSLVVSYMSELLSSPVKTFSIGFHEKEYNELKYARAIAEQYQTEHYEEILEPDALTMLPDLVSQYGEPFGDSSSIPTYYVSKLAGSKVKMVLSGDGGDEAFAGYDTYLRWINDLSYPGVSKTKKMLYPLGRAIYPHRYMKRNSYQHWMEIVRYYPYELRKQLYEGKLDIFPNYDSKLFGTLFKEAENFDHVQKAQYMDLGTYLPYDILTKVDIASMAHSLEVRTPLIDTKVWDHISKIPSSHHFSGEKSEFTGKILLKKLLASKTSEEFAFREKKGFAVPLSKWFGDQDQKVIDRLMDSNHLFEYFHKPTVKEILQDGIGRRIWLLLFLDEWLHQFSTLQK
ncbi:MAG: asparagine synthase (glutamine-hydrolyzing) [Bacteroidota bacterium]